MSSLMPAGRTLWLVDIRYEAEGRTRKKKLNITSEGKAIADGFAAANEFLDLQHNRYPSAQIKAITWKGIIHA